MGSPRLPKIRVTLCLPCADFVHLGDITRGLFCAKEAMFFSPSLRVLHPPEWVSTEKICRFGKSARLRMSFTKLKGSNTCNDYSSESLRSAKTMAANQTIVTMRTTCESRQSIATQVDSTTTTFVLMSPLSFVINGACIGRQQRIA